VILIGQGEWEGLIDWLRDRVLADHRIDADDLKGLKLVDRTAEVVQIVGAAGKRRQEQRSRQLPRRARR
jgi:hypothetical protein